MNFDFKDGCKNEFKGNNEKSCSWTRNRVSHKIDFKAQRLRNGHADSVGVNEKFLVLVLSPRSGIISQQKSNENNQTLSFWDLSPEFFIVIFLGRSVPLILIEK